MFDVLTFRFVKKLIEKETSIKTTQQTLVNEKDVELDDNRTIQQHEVVRCLLIAPS